VIGLDNNILARYYLDDDADAEAAKQHEAACRLIDGGEALRVSKTLLLELEWVMRGYYRIGPRWSRHSTTMARVSTLPTACTMRAIPDVIACPPSMIAALPAAPAGWGCCRP